jgi:hypothetical protein
MYQSVYGQGMGIEPDVMMDEMLLVRRRIFEVLMCVFVMMSLNTYMMIMLFTSSNMAMDRMIFYSIFLTVIYMSGVRIISIEWPRYQQSAQNLEQRTASVV